uniref:TSA: Wollemia nobilis Ref_Wollemi_Transcript_15883_2666 transcribed RNA sequence n=1 Tax=Wollemia nobilis TaxID=56998 RepID=A0A0C9S600_9CONI
MESAGCGNFLLILFLSYVFLGRATAEDLDVLRDAFHSVTGFNITEACSGSCDSVLNLTSRNLRGSVNWRKFAELTSLQTLDLSNNFLSGYIGADLWTMQSLRNLNLASNQFGGHLTFDWRQGSSSALETINLSNNRLSVYDDALDLSGFKSLRFVDLSANRIASNKLLAGLLNLTAIANISLSGSSLGSIARPPLWSQWYDALQHLDLSSCNLNGSVSNLANLTSLQYLDLSNNNLTGDFPGDFRNFVNLQFLNISGNEFRGTLKAENITRFGRFAFLGSGLCNASLRVPCAAIAKAKTPPAAAGNATAAAPSPSISTGAARLPSSSHGLSKSAIAGISSAAAVVVIFAAAIAGAALYVRRRRAHLATKEWVVPKSPGPFRMDRPVVESGPFSFETDAGSEWVADIKDSTSAPVVLFEKPLLALTFTDLLALTSHFSKESQMAEGHHGPVYRAVLPGDVHVAIKVLEQAKDVDVEDATSKLHALGRLKHPNILPLLGYCIAGKEKLLIYEFMHNGDLHQWLHELPGVQPGGDTDSATWEPAEAEDDVEEPLPRLSGERMGWFTRHKIALGMARALAFLHHGCFPPITHGGLSSCNVLLDDRFEPHVAEAGIKDLLNTAHSGSIREAEESAKSDVYGFGVVLLELVTGRMASGDEFPDGFAGDLVGWVRHLIKEKQGDCVLDPRLVNTVPVNLMLETLRIGYLCTAESPSKRPSMQQVVGLLKDVQPDRANS